MNGQTMKQFHIAEFWRALEAYRHALETSENIVGTSLRIHIAKGGVPKVYHRHANRVWRETRRTKP